LVRTLLLILLSIFSFSKAQDYIVLPVYVLTVPSDKKEEEEKKEEKKKVDEINFQQFQGLSNLDRMQVIEYCFYKYSKLTGISMDIYRAIAKVESNFNPYAINVNKNGTVDIGLMQINESTARYYGYNPRELFNVCKNVEVASLKIRDCYKRYGNTYETVGCYHSEKLFHKVRYVKNIKNALMSLKYQRQLRY